MSSDCSDAYGIGGGMIFVADLMFVIVCAILVKVISWRAPVKQPRTDNIFLQEWHTIAVGTITLFAFFEAQIATGLAYHYAHVLPVEFCATNVPTIRVGFLAGVAWFTFISGIVIIAIPRWSLSARSWISSMAFMLVWLTILLILWGTGLGIARVHIDCLYPGSYCSDLNGVVGLGVFEGVLVLLLFIATAGRSGYLLTHRDVGHV